MAENGSPAGTVQPAVSQQTPLPSQTAITLSTGKSPKDHIDWGGSVWDIANSLAAAFAIFVALYGTWSTRQAKEFDDEYGNRLLKGCDKVRDFLDRILTAANIPNQTVRHKEADNLLAQWNSNIHPLQNALKYADDYFCKNIKKNGWSDCGLALYDNVADMLDALSFNAAQNWKQSYDRNERAANEQLAAIHARIKESRKKVSCRFGLF